MANYLDKWKTDFPETVNNQTRPTAGLDNSLEFNTDGFPQRITGDPVHAKLENDIGSQLFSNDQRLKETIDSLGTQEAAHEKDKSAHSTGISGNAATATKLNTARTIAISGKVTGAATAFDGSKNISINTTAVTADNCTGNSATATYATSAGSATSASNATNATNDNAGQNIRNTYIKNLSISGRTITFTRGDNTTGQIITQDTSKEYDVMVGASSYYNGASGLVPAPKSGDNTRFLAGDGTWKPQSTIATSCTGNSATATNATNDSYGQNIRSTYIKALSCSGTRITYTRGDNTTGYFYTQDTNTTYNDFSGAGSYYSGSHGLVPAPSSGYQDRFLAGSGDWEAFSAAYQAMQSLSPSSDKIPYFTGSASAALATLTSFARSILDDTSADAVRSTINANASTCGGIVAQSLTQNGYVKFANGLIIQWGNAGIDDGKTYGNFSLPISVSNVLAVFALDLDTSSTNGATIGDYYTVTYKPEFSNGSRLRFVTKGTSMGAFAVLVICK